MNPPIIFMFSGQGSQYYQMGRELFATNQTFKNHMLKADQLCQDLIGQSVVSHIYDDSKRRSQPFAETLLTHPAIFMVEYALAQVLIDNNIHPDFVLGASLGEFAAAAISGILDVESALQAVIRQAQSLEDCPTGSMLAILHDPHLYHTQAYLHEYSELAAVNFSSHFVVSGNLENLNKIVARLNDSSITSQLLPVSVAFHSSAIDGAKTRFLDSIKQLEIKKSRIPFISCMQAKVETDITHKHFWDIIRSCILFQDTIDHLAAQQAAIYLDVGPSGTLATFVKYILAANAESKPLAVLTPFSQDLQNLEKAIDFMHKRK